MCNKNILKQMFAKERRLPTFCRPQNWQSSIFLCILIQIIVFLVQKGRCQFWLSSSQKLANVHPGQNVSNCTSPKFGGASKGMNSSLEILRMIYKDLRRLKSSGPHTLA